MSNALYALYKHTVKCYDAITIDNKEVKHTIVYYRLVQGV